VTHVKISSSSKFDNLPISICRLKRNPTCMATDLDIDNVIERLLDVRGTRPGKQVNLTENEVRMLCIRSREIFMSQPMLLELEAPIKICGEIWP
jgi:hypothetical protein